MPRPSQEGSTLSSSLPDIHDSELERIEKVVQVLNDRTGQHRDREAFRREIIERFEEIGFGVDVLVYAPGEWVECKVCEGKGVIFGGIQCLECEGRCEVLAAQQPKITSDTPIYFKISLERRLAGEFDPDRQVHEVTKDILGLGTEGVIKSNPSDLIVPHSHGHGGHHHH